MMKRDKQWENRFAASKVTLMADKFMNQFIRAGGLLVILTVMLIFVFILLEILPLFRGAQIKELRTAAIPPGDYLALGVDEWTERPFVLRRDGRLLFPGLDEGTETLVPELDFLRDHQVTSVTYGQETQQLIYGTALGEFVIVDIVYSANFSTGSRVVDVELRPGNMYPLGERGEAILAIAYAGADRSKVIVGITEGADGERHLRMATLTQTMSLMGPGEIEVGLMMDLTAELPGVPQEVLVSQNGRSILVRNDRDEVAYFQFVAGEVELRQLIRPFEGSDAAPLAKMNFLFGDTTVLFTNSDGVSYGFSLYMHDDVGKMLWGKTKEFPPLEGAPSVYAKSLRNKGFLIGHGNQVSLRYATTASVRWKKRLDYEPRLAAVSGKYDRILLLDNQSNLHLFSLNDPHPEAGFAAYFSRIWYEGNPEPEYKWQSTGASDDFEPKLSMIPLIVGTFKGTIYALLFAVPIALLGAIYVSQFQHPKFKSYVKPTMEIMASLPSVVLGFLAALWLAPIVETRVPSFLLFVIAIPVVAMFSGALWSRLPKRTRLLCPDGFEFIGFLPILVLTWIAAWYLGPVIERIFFVIETDAGRKVADFRLWWPAVTGNRFEQRNALVVGFIMGFAVIPIIFTIAEDALSNVPRSLSSASLALGASRWQTALRVVLPTASAGIFSAIMIGLGRAVGETMIVLMATGNTPLLDLNIFSGMRTLSANIAVELPEAPKEGTLYRTLFLGGFLLFLMTFIVNTMAELLRQHLRGKYKTI